MPEMRFTVEWPDGRREHCYSPSLVVHDHLRADATYRVDDFVERSTTALRLASERVRARYGFACTSAAETLEQIEASARRYPGAAFVRVLELEPGLPVEPAS